MLQKDPELKASLSLSVIWGHSEQHEALPKDKNKAEKQQHINSVKSFILEYKSR